MCDVHICLHNLHLFIRPAVYVHLTHFPFQVRSSNCEKRLLVRSYLYVRPFVRPPAWNHSTPTGQIFMQFDIEYFSKICQESLSFIKI